MPPLALPDPQHVSVESLPGYESVALFLARAQAARRDFTVTDDNAAAIAEICARLDGLPLAIELAAARVKLLRPAALLSRLDQRLDVLTGGARDLDERQQTLRAAIEWSYRLLDDVERRLFDRMAVFVGGCTLDALQAVCSPDGDLDVLDGVGALVDNNLLRQEEGPDGEPRFVMLETIHEFARERLAERGESNAGAMRHAAYFLDAATAHRASSAGEARDFRALRPEHANLRAALETFRAAQDVDRELSLSGALGRFWHVEGHFSEGRLALESALRRASAASNDDRAKALNALSALTYHQGDYGAARAATVEALECARRGSDRRVLADALENLGGDLLVAGDLDRGIELITEVAAIRSELGDEKSRMNAVVNLAYAHLLRGDADAAAGVLEAVAVEFGAAGELENVAYTTLTNLGYARLAQKRWDDAMHLFREGLERAARSGNKLAIGYNLIGLASALSRTDAIAAARLAGSAEAAFASLEAVLEPYEAKLLEQTLAELRNVLGDERLEAVLAEGRAMPLEEATALALGDRG